MPVAYTKTSSMLTPEEVVKLYEESSNVKVDYYVVRSDGYVEIGYTEIEEERSGDDELLDAIKKAFDALSDIDELARRRPIERERKISRRWDRE